MASKFAVPDKIHCCYQDTTWVKASQCSLSLFVQDVFENILTSSKPEFIVNQASSAFRRLVSRLCFSKPMDCIAALSFFASFFGYSVNNTIFGTTRFSVTKLF